MAEPGVWLSSGGQNYQRSDVPLWQWMFVTVRTSLHNCFPGAVWLSHVPGPQGPWGKSCPQTANLARPGTCRILPSLWSLLAGFELRLLEVEINLSLSVSISECVSLSPPHSLTHSPALSPSPPCSPQSIVPPRHWLFLCSQVESQSRLRWNRGGTVTHLQRKLI